MNQSPHWPRVGKYIGVCPAETDFIILCPPNLREIALELIEPDYQRRRVYQDELDLFNSYSEKKYGKSIIEMVNKINKELNEMLIKMTDIIIKENEK